MKKLVKSYPVDPKFYQNKMNQKFKKYNDIKINFEEFEDQQKIIDKFFEWWQMFWFQKGFRNNDDID